MNAPEQRAASSYTVNDEWADDDPVIISSNEIYIVDVIGNVLLLVDHVIPEGQSQMKQQLLQLLRTH